MANVGCKANKEVLAQKEKKVAELVEKIKKANASIEAYRARLESKFKSMDSLIAQMQNQYNSFLNV